MTAQAVNLWLPTRSGAISVVHDNNVASWQGEAGVTTRTHTLGGSLQEGDLVLLAYACGGTSDLAITPPTGWSELVEHYANGSTHDINAALFYKFMGPTPDSSAILNVPTTTTLSYGVLGIAFRNVDPNDPFSATPTLNNGTGSGNDPAAITPDTNGSCVVCAGFQGCTSGAWYDDPADLTNWTRWGETAATNDWLGAMGVALDKNAGVSFNPGAWTGGSGLAGTSWLSITAALKPKG